jgi:hypothetical protein
MAAPVIMPRLTHNNPSPHAKISLSMPQLITPRTSSEGHLTRNSSEKLAGKNPSHMGSTQRIIVMSERGQKNDSQSIINNNNMTS